MIFRGIARAPEIGHRAWLLLAIAGAVSLLLGTYPIGSPGVRGRYTRSTDFFGEAFTRIDAVPSATGAILAMGPIPPVAFSATWTAFLVVDEPGTYQAACAAASGWCRVELQSQRLFDTRDRANRADAVLQPGVYPLIVQATAGPGRLDVDTTWNRAGEPVAALRPELVYPRHISLEEFRLQARGRRAQGVLRTLSGAIFLLLALDWARARGAVGWLIAGATALFTVAVQLNTPEWIRGPIEWRWPYRLGALNQRPFAALATAGVVLFAIGLAGSATARRRTRRASLLLLACGCAAGFVFQIALLDVEPGGWQQTVVDRSWDGNGYLRAAGLTSKISASELLHTYPELMPTLSLHATTHPPGPTLFFRSLVFAARRLGVAAVEPLFVLGSSQVPGAVPLTWVGLAGSLILAASAPLTAVPIALAVWLLTRDSLHATGAALLWLFCPGPALFVPQSDQAGALLVASAFALLLLAQQTTRIDWLPAAASGLVAGLSLFWSYGLAPMLGAAVVLCGYRIDDPSARRRYMRTIAWWCGGAVVGVFAPQALGYPVVRSALTGLRLHHDFTLRRDAVTWLIFNPLDFGVFFGVVSVAATAVILVRRIAGRRSPRPAVWRLLPMACVLIALVDASGQTRGEVGRLWMPFMPLLFVSVWSAPALFGHEPLSFSRDVRNGVVIGALSALWCVTLRLYWLL